LTWFVDALRIVPHDRRVISFKAGVPYTRGFRTWLDLMEHYNRHGAELGARTPQEYEDLADKFLGGPGTASTHQCVRRNGDVVRYNPITNELGILSGAGVIKTYFEPDPNIHGMPTNWDYFKRQCKGP